MIFQKAFIFCISVLVALILLCIERLVGIGWDFHPDSVHYATNSINIFYGLKESGYLSFINGGYYILMFLLNQNILLVTSFNIFLYSITNVIIANIHWENKKYKVLSFALLLLLLNPYRIHLSTTMLKDTLVIFFLVISVYKLRYLLAFIVPLIMTRLVALSYFISMFNKKFLYLGFIFALLLFYLFPDIVFDRLDASSSIDLRTREFDRIPAFQEYGNIGNFIRAMIWPLLAFTGMFAIISPSFAFLMVGIGIIMNIIYTYITYDKFSITFSAYLPIALLAILAPGFTSFIRYAYPIIVITPLLVGIKYNKSGIN